MQIKLLTEEACVAEKLYAPFIDNRLNPRHAPNLFSEKEVYLGEVDPFPFYLGRGSETERSNMFRKAIDIFERDYSQLEREYKMDKRFWYSLYLTHFRNYSLNKYPQISEDIKDFKNVLLKKFDWENYIYKIVLITEYVSLTYDDFEEKEFYYDLILRNLDIFNYLIKYSIFRNRVFIMNVFKIIAENDLTESLKSDIEFYKKEGRDERFGRRVVFELNRRYPVLLSPMMSYKKLENVFLDILNKYKKRDLNA